MNVAGVRESGVISLVTTVLKFVPVLLIGLIGLFYMHSGNFSPVDPHHVSLAGHWHAISFAATLTLWAFIGLESATVPAEEVKDPERTLPRATMFGTVATTLLYILATVSIMGVIPASTLANSNAPFADAARQIFGSSVLGMSPAKIVAAVAMISTLGALNGWILIQGRVPLAAAQDGLFPKAFAQVSGTRKTPVVGLVASSVLLSALMGMNYQSSLSDMFVKIIVLATITTLVPYAFSAGAQLMLMFKDPERFSGRRLALDATIAVLAFAYSFWMVYGAGETYIAQGFLLLLAGIPVYIWIKWRQSEAITAIPRGAAWRARPTAWPHRSGRRLEPDDDQRRHDSHIGRPDHGGRIQRPPAGRPLRGRGAANGAGAPARPRAGAAHTAQQGRPAVRRRALGQARPPGARRLLRRARRARHPGARGTAPAGRDDRAGRREVEPARSHHLSGRSGHAAGSRAAGVARHRCRRPSWRSG